MGVENAVYLSNKKAQQFAPCKLLGFEIYMMLGVHMYGPGRLYFHLQRVK
jgi:hypothetical protein